MTEIQELEGLQLHPGWLRMKAWIEDEFLKRCLEDIEHAYDITEATEREKRIMQIFAGKRVARVIADWPEQRIVKLKQVAAKPTATLARGGF